MPITTDEEGPEPEYGKYAFLDVPSPTGVSGLGGRAFVLSQQLH